MPRSWEPSFDLYFTDLDDSPYSFVLDLAAGEHAPVASHPVRAQLRVAMKDPYENGLRSSEEAAALHALEDALDERLAAELDGIYVGRYVGEGFTTFAFYMPAELADAVDRIGTAAGDVAPYELMIGVKSDPDWELYTAYLYPDEYGMQ